jgi:hypothetical protein
MSSGILLLTGLFATGPVVAPPEIVPVQPWETNQVQNRVPIAPPVRAGMPAPICEEPPTDEEALAKLPRLPRGVPHVLRTFREDIVIVKNRIKDTIDAPRNFPLVGIAQLHRCHWECVAHYTELVVSEFPFPTESRYKRTATIYIDKDFLHAVADEPAPKRTLEFRVDVTPQGVKPAVRLTVPPLGPNTGLPANPPPEIHAMMLQTFGQMGAPVPMPMPVPTMCPPVMPAAAAWTAPALSPTLVTELPEGTWVRTVGPVRYKLEIKPRTLVITTTVNDEEDDGRVVAIDHVMTIDWYPTRSESEIIGLVKSFDVVTNDKTLSRDDASGLLNSLADIQKQLGGKPVALTWRLNNGGLVVGDVRFPELKGDGYAELSSALAALGGNYKSHTGQALPVIQATFAQPRALEPKGGTKTLIWDPAVPKEPGLQHGPTFWPDDPAAPKRVEFQKQMQQRNTNPFRNGGEFSPYPKLWVDVPLSTDVPLLIEEPALPPMPPPAPLPGEKVNPFRNGGMVTPERIHGEIMLLPLPSTGTGFLRKTDPDARMQQLLYQSEDLRQIGSEWRRFWFPDDQPGHLTPERIHGGIMMTDWFGTERLWWYGRPGRLTASADANFF